MILEIVSYLLYNFNRIGDHMNKKGFTLIELLAVIAILGVLATIGVTAVIKIYNDSIKKTMIVQENNVASVSKNYLEDYCFDPLDGSYNCPKSYDNNTNNRYICLSDLQENEKDNYINKVTYKNEDCKGIIVFSKDDDGEYTKAKTYLYCDYDSKNNKYNYITDETLDTSLYPRCDISFTKERVDVNPTYCTFVGELKQGAEYVRGQYTYRYKQEFNYTEDYKLDWVNISNDGWGVTLTDKSSSEPVVSKLCTTINDKPIVSMSNMFNNSYALSFDLSSFDTSKVVNMQGMFSHLSGLDYANSNYDNSASAIKLNSLDNSNNSNILPMRRSLASKIDLSTFDTSNVTNMSAMFMWSSFKELDLRTFDTSKVTDMGSMFSCSYATVIKGLNKFNTSKVTDMQYMFKNSYATTLDVSNFDTSNVTNMSSMFDGSYAATLDLSSFDTSKVTNMYYMFEGSRATTIDVSSFDTSKVTDMQYMFKNSYATTLDVSNFDTSNVTNMSSMFDGSYAATLDLSSFDTSKVTNMYYMFEGSRATTIDVSNFDTSKVTDMSEMFADSQTTILDLSSFDTSNVEYMWNMFYDSKNLKTIYVSNKFNTNNVVSSSHMFSSCTSLVGGSGTVYDSSKIDKTYARIDGGTSNPGYFTSKNSSTNAGKYIRNLSPQGLETTARDGLYRFVGTSNNYINIGGISYRIIGITDNSTINTSLGLKENQLKLIKATPVETYVWSSSRTYNYPFGNSSNDLYTYLNNTVINNTSVIPSSFKNSISSVKWYNGDDSYGTSASAIASYEMKSITGETAKLGLMYLSDYFYSSTYGGTTNCYNATCNSSWIYNSSYNQWTMSRNGRTNNTGYIAGSIDTFGKTNNTMVVYSLYYSPVFYLNENMVVSSGNGSFTTPFVISTK